MLQRFHILIQLLCSLLDIIHRGINGITNALIRDQSGQRSFTFIHLRYNFGIRKKEENQMFPMESPEKNN